MLVQVPYSCYSVRTVDTSHLMSKVQLLLKKLGWLNSWCTIKKKTRRKTKGRHDNSYLEKTVTEKTFLNILKNNKNNMLKDNNSTASLFTMSPFVSMGSIAFLIHFYIFLFYMKMLLTINNHLKWEI